MHPFSYNGIKILHEEKVQEALERQPLYAEQEAQRHGLLQALGKVLARFNGHTAREQTRPVADCA